MKNNHFRTHTVLHRKAPSLQPILIEEVLFNGRTFICRQQQKNLIQKLLEIQEVSEKIMETSNKQLMVSISDVEYPEFSAPCYHTEIPEKTSKINVTHAARTTTINILLEF